MPLYKTHIIVPPLSLGYLAGSLRKEGHEVDIVDCLRDKITHKKFSNILAEQKPDIVGFTAMTAYYPDAQKYISIAHSAGIMAVLGGPHASALPEQTLNETPELDFVVVGEGEETFVDLLKNLKNPEKVRGIAFRDGNNIRINEPRDLIRNIDDLTLAWDLIPPNKYPNSPHGTVAKNFPVAPVITSRGCAFDCTFCTSKVTWRRRVRFRSPSKVVDEIGMLVKNYGVKEIDIEDDNFTLNKEHAMRICDEIIKRNLKISLACPSGIRIDSLNDELVKKMKKAGFYLIGFGIENGNQEIIDRIGKGFKLDAVQKVVKMVNDVGMLSYGFFIIGLPGETNKTIQNTIKFSISAGFKRATFSLFSPLPGSKDFDDWVKKNNIAHFDWSKHRLDEAVFETDILSAEKLKKWQTLAFRKFYMKPKNMWNLITYMKLSQIKFLITAMREYL
jgi:radical SAM superfamily enzyme YgiQ (UPF0313 family)